MNCNATDSPCKHMCEHSIQERDPWESKQESKTAGCSPYHPLYTPIDSLWLAFQGTQRCSITKWPGNSYTSNKFHARTLYHHPLQFSPKPRCHQVHRPWRFREFKSRVLLPTVGRRCRLIWWPFKLFERNQGILMVLMLCLARLLIIARLEGHWDSLIPTQHTSNTKK